MKPRRLPHSRLLRKKIGVAALAALLLVLFLFRPGVYRLRHRIATSIGTTLGRRVAIDNVRLRLLPRPGFDLEGLVIYDDPSFSAEPMIRAQEVSAAIRFRSLLRGRLEIATLSASEPSINLVRNNAGLWNLSTLIERNAQIPAAPTSKPASERRRAFPYLEASNARINFKLGQIKKSYALINADVALWQDSENSWGARLKAEPVRTDFNLTDTGLLQINAAWQRAPSLRLTPLHMTIAWRNGQLGQLTKLFSGKDRGWRGGVDLNANLSGTPEALQIDSAAVIDGFHRYDIVGTESLRLASACSARYNAPAHSFSGLLCESPISGGTLRLSGSFALASQPVYDLVLQAEKIPLTSVVRFLRQAKQQVPADLTATGLLNAEFHGARSQPSLRNTMRRGRSKNKVEAQPWSGAGAATNVRVLWNSGKEQANLGTIPLTLVTSDTLTTSLPNSRPPENSRSVMRKRGDFHEPAEACLRLGPVALAMNDSPPLDAGGWISRSGYRFFLRGGAELKDLFALENVLALPVVHPAAEGTARLDVIVSGQWQSFAAAGTAGTVQLLNVRALVHGLNPPLAISSALMTLTPDAVTMDKITASTGNTHWSGRVTALRHCAAPGLATGVPACVFQFNLTADRLSAADLVEWFTRHPAQRPWYRILDSTSSSGNEPRAPSPLLALQARGNLRVANFELKKLSAAGLTTHFEMDRGKIMLKALHAQLLQGTHAGDWTIDLSNQDANSAPVRYRASGTLQDIALADLGTLMNDPWITGTADGKFELEGSADNVHELLTHSDGKLHFIMRNGSLPHLEIPGSPVPLPVHRFAGEFRLKNTLWELVAGKLESHDGIYQVRGTVSPINGFEFLLTRADRQSWTLTGTLAKPQVSPAIQTEAHRTEQDGKSVRP